MDAAFSHTFCVTSTGKHTAAYINHALSDTGTAAAGNAQKHQNIVAALDNPAESGIINIESIPREQREAVHRQADILERVGIWMRNRWPALSAGLREEMCAMYTPDEWALIDNKIDADEWENIQFAQMLKNGGDSVASTDTETAVPEIEKTANRRQTNPRKEKLFWLIEGQQEAAFLHTVDESRLYAEDIYASDDWQQKLNEQARTLDALKVWWHDHSRTSSPQVLELLYEIYRDAPDQWAVISGEASAAAWLHRQKQSEGERRAEWKVTQSEQNTIMEMQAERSQYEWGERAEPWANQIPLDNTPKWQNVEGERVLHLCVVEREVKNEAEPDAKPEIEFVALSGEELEAARMAGEEALDYEYIPLFVPTTMPQLMKKPEILEKYPEHDYPEQHLNLSFELQAHICTICRHIGMDYYLGIGIIPHESGSNQGDETTRGKDYQGLTQFGIEYMDDYQPGGMYYKHDDTAWIINYAVNHGADIYNIQDPLTAVAMGIAMYNEYYNTEGTVAGALMRYAGGTKGQPEKLMRQFLCCRNLLAQTDGQEIWEVPGLENSEDLWEWEKK